MSEEIKIRSATVDDAEELLKIYSYYDRRQFRVQNSDRRKFSRQNFSHAEKISFPRRGTCRKNFGLRLRP